MKSKKISNIQKIIKYLKTPNKNQKNILEKKSLNKKK